MSIALWKAVKQEELYQANLLVDQEYRRSGYLLTDDPELSNLQDSFPDVTVLITKNAHQVITGTITLILDSDSGLPADSLFQEDLAPFRRQAMRLGEIGRLAIKNACPGQSETRSILPTLYASIFATGLSFELDAFIITINPKHDPLYRKFHFQPLGAEKPHLTLKNAPALARILRIGNANNQFFSFLPKDPREILFSAAFQEGREPILFP